MTCSWALTCQADPRKLSCLLQLSPTTHCVQRLPLWFKKYWTWESWKRGQLSVDAVRHSIFLSALVPPRLQKFGRRQTSRGPPRAKGFTTVDNVLFRTMRGARMFCQKAMLSHCTKPKGCFGNPWAWPITEWWMVCVKGKNRDGFLSKIKM